MVAATFAVATTALAGPAAAAGADRPGTVGSYGVQIDRIAHTVTWSVDEAKDPATCRAGRRGTGRQDVISTGTASTTVFAVGGGTLAAPRVVSPTDLIGVPVRLTRATDLTYDFPGPPCPIPGLPAPDCGSRDVRVGMTLGGGSRAVVDSRVVGPPPFFLPDPPFRSCPAPVEAFPNLTRVSGPAAGAFTATTRRTRSITATGAGGPAPSASGETLRAAGTLRLRVRPRRVVPALVSTAPSPSFIPISRRGVRLRLRCPAGRVTCQGRVSVVLSRSRQGELPDSTAGRLVPAPVKAQGLGRRVAAGPVRIAPGRTATVTVPLLPGPQSAASLGRYAVDVLARLRDPRGGTFAYTVSDGQLRAR